MSLESHLVTMRRKHAHLDQELEYEKQRPLPHGPTIWRLKKEKLAIKDELARATASNDNTAIGADQAS